MTMKFDLRGVDALGNPARIGKDVVKFVDTKNRVSVYRCANPSIVKLVTSKGVYFMKKNANGKNIFQASISSNKVEVHLKAVSGWFGYH